MPSNIFHCTNFRSSDENKYNSKEDTLYHVDVTQMYQELIMNEDGQFRCTVCGKTMGHKANMERHVETHMTGLSYDCKHCGETFRSRNILKLHYQKHKRSLGRESS